MLFHEIYGAYFHAVGEIIRVAQEGRLDEKNLKRICDETAFSESFLEIIPALKEQRWPLLTRDSAPLLHNRPTRPLTLLEKRWLKSLESDRRFRLFGVEIDGLENVEPLFSADDIRIIDQYTDGDPYDDHGYIERFQTVLTAIRDQVPLRIRYRDRKGKEATFNCIPEGLEYSEKDDKFRVLCSHGRTGMINMQRLLDCRLAGRGPKPGSRPRESHIRSVTFLLTDERNTLERAMLHFAHFEKRAERIGKKQYRIELKYDWSDETEVLIRILSFGPMLKVIEPDSFVQLIRDRLIRQSEALRIGPPRVKTAVIFIGIQASGKTTYFNDHFSDRCVHINLDELHTRNRERELIEESIRGERDYVVDNTNPTKADRKRYIEQAKAAGYRVVGYYFESRLKDCITRNELREGKARIEPKAIAATSNRLQLPNKAEGFDELYYVEHRGTKMIKKDWRDEDGI